MNDIASLVFRIGFAVPMAVGHGYPKLMKILEGKAAQFADPFGLGPEISIYLATGAEFFGCLLIVAGLQTRIMSAMMAFTMFTAAFIAHASDPFFPVRVATETGARAMLPFQEFAFIYFVGFLGLVFLGSGRFSVDNFLPKKKR